VPDTPQVTLAKCVLRWIYSQIAAILEALKAVLLAIIALIDAYIIWLRAWLAQFDILSKIEEAAWAIAQALIDQVRNMLTSIPEGPLKELCPEFYQLFSDPALQMFDTAVAGLTIWRERYKNVVSFMDEIDRLIGYWESIKFDLEGTVQILDDAILLALMDAAEEVP
jgi:hypothetical protein